MEALIFVFSYIIIGFVLGKIYRMSGLEDVHKVGVPAQLLVVLWPVVLPIVLVALALYYVDKIL